MVIKKPSVYFYFGLVLCALFSIALRWKMLNFPLTVDEGAYAYITYFWQQGGELYSELWLDRPQGIFVIYRIIFNTFGYSIENIRLFTAVYNSFTVFMLGLLGKKLINWQTGLLASFFFAIFSSGLRIEGFTANTESFINLPVVLSLYLLINTNKSRTRIFGFIFLSGLVASLAFLIKASGISALLMGFGYLWIIRPYKNRIVSYLTFIVGYIAGLIPAYIHGMQDSIREFYWAIFGWRLSEYNIFGERFFSQFYKLWQTILFLLPEILPLCIILIIWILLLTKKRSKNDFVSLIFLSSSILAIAPAGDWFRHYFIQIIPAATLICASTIHALQQQKLLTNKKLLFILLLGFFSFIATNLPQYTTVSIQKMDDVIYSNYFQYELNDQVSSYINNHTKPTDTIYVFFSQAQIYYLSQRKPAYHYTFAAHILTDNDFQNNLISIINSPNAPKYLIKYKDFKYMDNFPQLKLEIEDLYFLENEISTVEFYRRSVD